MSAPSLRELQSWMRWAITDPRGVDAALAEPHPAGREARYQAPRPDVRAWLDEKADFAGLAIYAEAYFARILESLASDFPATRGHLGEEDFTRLVAEYLKIYPSRVSNIGEVGRRFSEFAAARAESIFDAPVWLADLIGLEWAMIESFSSPAGAGFDPQTLTDAADADWGCAVFQFEPGVRLVSSRWSLDEIRQAGEALNLEANETDLTVVWPEQLTALLIYRKSGFARVMTLETTESACLDALRTGASLDEALETAATDSSRDLNEKIGVWFAKWTSLGLFERIEFGRR